MAGFNPETGVDTIGRDFLNYAGGPDPANKSLATLFGGVGDAVVGAAQIADNQIQENIKLDVQNKLDETNKLFGYTPDDVPATVGEPTKAPPELSEASLRLNKIQAAKAQGKLNDSQYWAMLTNAAKDLKSRYAGYSDQIDQIVAKTTGGTPANMLRASLAAYNERLAGNASDSEKSDRSWFISHGDEITAAIPGFRIDDPNMANPAWRASVMQQVNTRAAPMVNNKILNDQITTEKNITESTREKAAIAYGNQTQAEADSVMTQIARDSGLATMSQTAFEGLDAALSTAKPDPTQLEKIQTYIKTARNALQNRFVSLGGQPIGGALSPDQRANAEKNAMRRLDAMQDMLTSGDTGQLGRYTRANNFAISQDVNFLRNSQVFIRRAAALNIIAPSIAPNYAQAAGNEIVQAMNGLGITRSIMGGDATPDEVINAAKADKNVSKTDLQAVTTNSIKAVGMALSDPNIPDSATAAVATKLFKTDGTSSLDQTWQKIAPSSRLDALMTMATTAAIDKVAKATGAEGARNMSAFIGHMAQSTPAVITMAGTMGSTSGDASVSYVFNPQTNQFLVAQSKMGAGSYMADATRRAAQLKLNDFNKVVGALAYANQKAGIDPQDKNNPNSVAGFLNVLGVKGSGGDIPALRKAFEEHSSTDTAPQSKTENASDFIFLSDPNTAQGLKEGDAKYGDIHSIIRAAESGKSGYDASVHDGGQPVAAFSKMTVSQVLQAQQSLPNSKAIGAYQFIPSTLHYAIDKAGIKLSDTFDESTQDKLATVLMEDAGLSRWKAGKITDNEFQNNLAAIWAGLPETSGMSHYEGTNGNHATVGVNDVRSALQRSKG